MKKVVIYLVALFLLSSGASAQITQLQTNVSYYYVLFHQASIKLIEPHIGDTVYINNLNNTHYDTILIPTVTPPENAGPGTGLIYYWSEDLFDTDPNTIEYLYVYSDASQIRHVRIIRQDGTILFSADSVTIGGYAIYPDVLLRSIVNTDSGTFMFLIKNSGATLYKLPGTLFCPACDGSNVPAYHITGIHNPINGNNMELRAFPNPSNNKTKIYYTLPEGVMDGDLILYDLLSQEKKRIRVNRYSPFIEVSTADIAAGNYFYRIQTSKGISQGRQQVVVH